MRGRGRRKLLAFTRMGTGLHTGTPEFARRSARLRMAYNFAHDAHERRRIQGGATIEHPAAVARLLHEAGYSEEVVAAALLHDVVEDTATGMDELADRFGPDIASLVAQLTENPGIRSYDRRKRELRRRATSDGQDAAAIFVADKLASARALNAHGAVADREKLEHYARTERTARRRHPGMPFLDPLAEEIARLRERAAHV
jgi:(p)ppGpp synthase/HD superfamily hydrolase